MIRIAPTILLACLAAIAAGADSDDPPILESSYARWRASLPDDYPRLSDFRRVLLRWAEGAERHWTSDDDHPDLGRCRMRSSHSHVCTARSLPIYAVLAVDPGNQAGRFDAARAAERLNAALAFLGRTYAGRKAGEDTWGIRPGRNSLRYETWIIGNMADALQIAEDAITEANRARIRQILIDVCEAERTSGRARSLDDYRHEGITWTINLLARAAVLYPDHPHAEEWLDLAKHGYASALSVQADLQDDTVVDGKPIREWVARRCPVFHPDHTLSHHGLGIHPGYMAGATHRVVSLYDLLKRRGRPVSPVWLHHFHDVWAVLKRLALWDGRIAFPNGKDWGDYLYLVSSIRFHMAGLQMMDGDRQARLLERGLFRHIDWLQRQRSDGSFGPSDAEYVFNVNDAKNVAFPYWFHLAHGFSPAATQEELDRAIQGVFYSPHADFICVRDPRRFASWGWRARRGRSTGLVLPSGHGLGDHLAQWDDNLIPDYWWTDDDGDRHALDLRGAERDVEPFEGGFAVSERTELSHTFDHRCIVAVPDGRTVLVIARGEATRPVSRVGTMDLNWRFVRNAFSDDRRLLFVQGGKHAAVTVRGVETPWANVDGVLGLIAVGKPMKITCEPVGEVDEQGRPTAERDEYGATAGQTLRLSARSRLGPHPFEPGAEIFTVAVAFVTDVTAAETARVAGDFTEQRPAAGVRICRVPGFNGKQYAVAVNFTDEDVAVHLAVPSDAMLLTPKAARAVREARRLKLTLRARGCAVLQYVGGTSE